MTRTWEILAAASALFLTVSATPLNANRIIEFRARPTRDYSPNAREGWCSVRVWVDDEVHVYLRGDRVRFENLRGRRPYDAGTECSGPLPQGPMRFRFRGIDGRGDVDLVEEPSRRNGYTSWVRILDRKGGGEEHHFRIYWRWDGNWDRRGAGSGSGGNYNDDWDRREDWDDRRRRSRW